MSEELLTGDIIGRLDAFIQGRLDRGMEVVSIRTKDHRVKELFPVHWPEKRVAASLRRYMMQRQWKWQIDHRDNSHQYHISTKPGLRTAKQRVVVQQELAVC
jgi:hypothetical protein